MNTTWRFSNLTSLADYLENKANGYREHAKHFKPKSLKHRDYVARATESESIVYLLRHTELTEGVS